MSGRRNIFDAVDFFSVAAQVVPVLYLAVIFQTLGAPGPTRWGSPFRSGLYFTDPAAPVNGWKDASLILGVQVAAFGGEACALTAASAPVVAGALAFLGTLVAIPQTLWAALRVANDHVRANQNAVLNAAFGAPWTIALVALLLVALS